MTYSDHTCFLKVTSSLFLCVIVYVDDIIISSNSDFVVETLKSQLKSFFKLRDLGEMKYFLSLEIARSSDGIHVCQRKYALDLLDETCLLGCKPSSIPMDPSIKFTSETGGELVDAGAYRRLIGRLMYLQITRPDITFAVNKLSQFSSAPRESHHKALLKILLMQIGIHVKTLDVQLLGFVYSWVHLSLLGSRRSSKLLPKVSLKLSIGVSLSSLMMFSGLLTFSKSSIFLSVSPHCSFATTLLPFTLLIILFSMSVPRMLKWTVIVCVNVWLLVCTNSFMSGQIFNSLILSLRLCIQLHFRGLWARWVSSISSSHLERDYYCI